ncbi:MFS transporter [Alsobacter sp. SYSU M60028]|uniref:MFS transporter n=1 Tax=Alsobacter ponti TaxID=2962936 RepID=A0ABT1LIK8_9HYPH|nr:MFS transporter [Alsobacter ponti]
MRSFLPPLPAVFLAVTPLLAAVFILIAGNGIVSTLVPMRAALEGFNQAQIGYIGSAYFTGMLAGTWMAPSIVRRAGHIRAFSAYAAVAAVAALGFAAFVSPWLWVAYRAVFGFCFAGLYAIAEGWVSAKASDSNRGRMLAVYNIVHFCGSATGQQILRLADPRSFTLFSAGASFLVMALVPMAMTRAEPPPLPPKGRLELAGLWRASPIAFVGMALVGWANGAFWSLVPAYVENLQMGAGTVSSYMTAVILGSATGPYPLGRLSDRVDRRWVIAAVAIAAGIVELGLAAVGQPQAAVLYLFGFLTGLFLPSVYPLIVAHAVDRMGSAKAVAISSTLLFVYCCGGIIGPVAASELMARGGQVMLFVHNGVAHVLMAAFVAWRIVRRAPAVRVEADAAPAKPPGTPG